MRAITLFFRPFGAALGVFIALNLALALQRPELAVTKVWLDASLPEPWLSLFAGILGFFLLLPSEVAGSPSLRPFAGGVFIGFAVLSGRGAFDFYAGWVRKTIATEFPFPLCALITLVLGSEALRVLRWTQARSRLPPPARVFMRFLGATGAFLLITLVHILEFGHRDLRETADAAVILGAKVEPGGEPSGALKERLETGIDLYREGYVPYLVMSGGVDPSGQSEAVIMRRHAIERGVPPERILVDEEGTNTLASAVRCRELAREYRFGKVLAVTQYFHCARVKMVFEREGVRCHTVPARTGQPWTRLLARDLFFVFRETIAFPFYLVYYR